MPFLFLLKGLVVGFFLAVPIGPIGILCIRRALVHGIRRGIIVGLGGASADIVYASVAVFGVSFIYDFIDDQQYLLRLAGGILLLIVGAYTFRSHPVLEASATGLNNSTSEFISTFLLAITNPLTLFGFAAVLSGLGIEGAAGSILTLVALLAGVFLGSLLWFSSISLLVSHFKDRISTRGLTYGNKIAGSLLIVFGVLAVWSGLRGL